MARAANLEQEELQDKIGRLLPSQREFIYAPERYAAIDGGYATGKSRAVILRGLLLSYIFPGNRGMFGRFRATDLEDSVVPAFMEVCPPSWIRKHTRHAPGHHSVILRNNSFISFRHIHDANAKGTKTRRVGANYGWVGIDQMEELEEEHFNALDSRVRFPGTPAAPVTRHFLFGDANPAGHDWIYRRFFMGIPDKWKDGEFFKVVRNRPGHLGILTNSNENRESNGGFVKDDYFDAMLANFDPMWVERYIYGSFEDFTGKIYRSYVAGLEDERLASVHNIEPFDIRSRFPHWELVVGIDVGGDSPWAVVPEYIDDWGNTIAAQGLVKPGLTSREVANWIKTNLPWNNPNTTFVIDPENKVVLVELAEYGIHCVPARKERQAGIVRTQSYFHINKAMPLPPWYLETQPEDAYNRFAKKGSPRTFVFKTFREYRKDHDEYRWDDTKKNEPKITQTRRYDACDADRYIKMYRPLASKMKPNPDKYGELRRIDPLSAREWDSLDRRIAERVYRQKGGGAAREAFSENDFFQTYGAPNRIENEKFLGEEY
jgi:hypothetical protein